MKLLRFKLYARVLDLVLCLWTLLFEEGANVAEVDETPVGDVGATS